MIHRALRHHHHAPPDYNRAFAAGIALNLAFVVVEAVFGVLSDSLALLTDAGHNFSDVLGLLLAWGAAALAAKRPSTRRTYGYSRATIIASLFSGLLLMGAVGAIGWEAVNRAYRQFPTSTEQIMHPAKYLEQRDPPIEIGLPPRRVQRRWAALLERHDAGRRRREEAGKDRR